MNTNAVRFAVVVVGCCAVLLVLFMFRSHFGIPARPVPDYETFKRLALKDVEVKSVQNMRRLDILIIIAAFSVLTLIFYPSIILHKKSHVALFERFPKRIQKPTQNVQEKLKEVYKDDGDYDRSNDIIQKSWVEPLIVHGIHKPHLPERSKHWQRMNFLNKLLRLRPWPIFSPGPRFDAVQVSGELSSDPTLPTLRPKVIYTDTISTSSASNNTSSSSMTQGNGRTYLIKDMYQRYHFWPHSEICSRKFGSKSDGTKLLVVVTSSVRNVAARKAIRLTWGHYTTRKDVVVVFLVGRPTADHLDDLLREDRLFNDVIMGNTPESNMDATLRSVSMLEWVDIFCSNIHAVLKVKDDAFINVPQLMGFMKAPHRIVATKTIWGKLMHKIRPERKESKLPYFLPTDQFPESVLPDFLLGSAYLMTADAVQPMFNAALDLPYMRLEDVFMTGTLADRAKVIRVDAYKFFSFNVSRNICGIKKGIAFDKVPYNKQFYMWQLMHDTSIICRNSTNKLTKPMSQAPNVNIDGRKR